MRKTLLKMQRADQLMRRLIRESGSIDQYNHNRLYDRDFMERPDVKRCEEAVRDAAGHFCGLSAVDRMALRRQMSQKGLNR